MSISKTPASRVRGPLRQRRAKTHRMHLRSAGAVVETPVEATTEEAPVPTEEVPTEVEETASQEVQLLRALLAERDATIALLEGRLRVLERELEQANVEKEGDGIKNNDMNHEGLSVARAEAVELDDDEHGVVNSFNVSGSFIQLNERQTKKSTDYFVELPSGADEVITATLSLSDEAQVHPGVPATVTGRDIKKLNHGVSLNDEVVNHYFQMISQRASTEGRKVHCFNSFLYKELVKNGYRKIQRWTKRVDLFSMDVILFPIHLTNHWICGCIDIRAKTISVYDSFHGTHMDVLFGLRSYLEKEHLDKKKNALDIDAWRIISQTDVPSQKNGFDCGVFTCIFAMYLASDKEFDFQQQNMPQIRRRMVYEIKTNKLLDITSPTMQGPPSTNVALNTPALSIANQRTSPDGGTALPSDVQFPSIPPRAPNVTSIPKLAATEGDGLKNNDMNHGGSSVARAEAIELDDDEYGVFPLRPEDEDDGMKNHDMNQEGSSIAPAEAVELDDDEDEGPLPVFGPARHKGVFPLPPEEESDKENASCYPYGRIPVEPIVASPRSPSSFIGPVLPKGHVPQRQNVLQDKEEKVARGTKRSHDGDNVPVWKRPHH